MSKEWPMLECRMVRARARKVCATPEDRASLVSARLSFGVAQTFESAVSQVFQPAERGTIRARKTVRTRRRPESRRYGRLESLRYAGSSRRTRCRPLSFGVAQTFESAVSQVFPT